MPDRKRLAAQSSLFDVDGQATLTTLREKLVKIGARIVRHGRYVVFQLAEVVVPRMLFAAILPVPEGWADLPEQQRGRAGAARHCRWSAQLDVADSDRGGVEIAKLNGDDRQVWLADVLARIADHPARRITDLLPWNWRAEQLAAAVNAWAS